MALPKYTGRELTKHLKALAMEAEAMSDSGEVITKAEALARLIWKRALGYTEVKITESGPKEVACPPEVWAINTVLERLEGKVAPTLPEEAGKLSAAERISDLNRNRINALTTAGSSAPASKPLPPKLPSKKGV